MAVDYCAKLQAAQDAYDKLLNGEAVAEFQDQNGERVRYTSANASRLLARIKELEALCNPGTYTPRKAIGFLF